MPSFDVVVIGTGDAGANAAFASAEAGRTVAIIDNLPFGGTCALRGCDPKKVLVGAEELVDWSRRYAAHGAVHGNVSINWPNLMRFKRTFTEPVPAQREALYSEAGIVPFHGAARFINESVIAVNGEHLQANHIVIATGARPGDLRIVGAEHAITSDQFLELENLPSNIVFMGGGYISFEFAHLAARAGSKATIVHRGARPLARFDPDLVERLVQATREQSIDVDLGVEVTGIERKGGSYVVHTADRSYDADLVVHGAGRVADLDGLDLKAGGVATTPKGVKVNAFLQSTSSPNVYAAGDAADSGGMPFTPEAVLTGGIVAHNIVHGNEREGDFGALPTLVYTTPTLAAVGAGEDEARAKFGDVTVTTGDMGSWYSYRRVAEKTAAYKIIAHKGEDRVLGAHILGPGAEELANLFALAIRYRIPVSDLRESLFGYPTYGSDVQYMF